MSSIKLKRNPNEKEQGWNHFEEYIFDKIFKTIINSLSYVARVEFVL